MARKGNGGAALVLAERPQGNPQLFGRAHQRPAGQRAQLPGPLRGWEPPDSFRYRQQDRVDDLGHVTRGSGAGIGRF